MKRRYYVSPVEWERSEAKWRAFVESRPTHLGLPPLNPGRFHIPSGQVEWWEKDTEGEARFSKVMEAQHENCVPCEAKSVIEQDPSLTEADREKKVRGLEHKVPVFRPSCPTENPISLEKREEELKKVVGQSTWGDERGAAVQKRPKPSLMEELGKALPEADVFELRRGWSEEWRERGKYYEDTRHLLKNVDNGPLLDPAYLLRIHGLRQNEKTVEKAVESTQSLQRLSTADKRTIIKNVAEAWELKRDIARLESYQKSLKIRIERVKKGDVSVNWYTAKNAKARKERCRAIDLPVPYRPVQTIGSKVSEEAGSGEEHIWPVTPAAVELDATMERSPSPLNLTEPPEQQCLQDQPTQSASGPNKFFATLRNLHQQNLAAVQDDSKSSSTGDDPFKHDTLRSTTQGEAATPSESVQAGSASKGRMKKDSKTEEQMEEDGVNIKDFAGKAGEKKPGRLQTLRLRKSARR